MKIKNLDDIAAFNAAIAKCKGSVWLTSVYGDKFDLKSDISRYIAMSALLQDRYEQLELFASLPEDQGILIEFLRGLED